MEQASSRSQFCFTLRVDAQRVSSSIIRKAHGNERGLQSGGRTLRIETVTGDCEKAKPVAQTLVELDHRPILGLASRRVAGGDDSASRTIVAAYDNPRLKPKAFALADYCAAPHNMPCGKYVAAIDQEAAAVSEPFIANDANWPIGCKVREPIVSLEN